MSRTPMVVDASAAIAWVTNEDGKGPGLGAVFASSRLVVPTLWLIEVGNSLLVKERRRKYTAEQVTLLCAEIDLLDLEVVPDAVARPLAGLAAFARPHQLTTYDACYLRLAQRLALPLLTLDNNLQDAARRLGVPLVLDRQSPAP